MSTPLSKQPRPKVDRGEVTFIALGNSSLLRWLDLYHELLRRPWWVTIGALFGGWLFINATFAALYMIGGDCISAADPNSFLQAFSFSVQTISSIGYGAMHPTTPWAWVLADIEAFLGMLMVAMGTGLMFAKFSRPTARIDFSKLALIHLRDGQPHLVVRVANRRGNRLVGAQMKLAVFVDHSSPEGHQMRRLVELPLVRESTPTFALSMTLLHRIDETSPLHGVVPQTVNGSFTTMMLTIQGLDETFNQTVHAQYYYGPEHLRWDARFVDMIETRSDGGVAVHHDRLSLIEPMPAAHHIVSEAGT